MVEDWKDRLAELKRNQNQIEEKEIEESKDPEAKLLSLQSTPLNVVTERKGRNGKIATIIEGFTIDQTLVDGIAKNLKQKFGVGGSTRQGEILIQGDHKEVVKKYLKENNFKVK